MPLKVRTTRRGFTLVEAVSTVTVIAALGSLSSTILFNAIDGYTSVATRGQIQSELSIGLDQIVRELRKIPLRQDGSQLPSIDSVTPTSVAWNSDSDLWLDGSSLRLIVDGLPAFVILDDISAFAAQCYDEDGNVLPGTLSGSACTDVRRITITIALQRYGMTESLSTSLYLRNTMKDGTP